MGRNPEDSARRKRKTPQWLGRIDKRDNRGRRVEPGRTHRTHAPDTWDGQCSHQRRTAAHEAKVARHSGVHPTPLHLHCQHRAARLLTIAGVRRGLVACGASRVRVRTQHGAMDLCHAASAHGRLFEGGEHLRQLPPLQKRLHRRLRAQHIDTRHPSPQSSMAMSTRGVHSAGAAGDTPDGGVAAD